MPEGHTLRRLADSVSEAFGGRVVRLSSPQGRFAADAASLDGGSGTVLVGAESAGKHLFVELPGDRFVHVHLGLIGHFDVRPGRAPEPIGAIRLRIEAVDGSAYADLRGAITCDLVTGAARDETVRRLGPDPLRQDANPERAWQRVRRSPRPIGDLLMDQTVLAGIGNVFRAEVLFRNRLHPLRPGKTLRRGQFNAVWEDLVALLAEGVRTGRIDTVRPEHTPEATGRLPRKDDHGGEVYVYRRHGQPCHVCGARVRREELAGRNSFWCPRCQPAFRSRAVG